MQIKNLKKTLNFKTRENIVKRGVAYDNACTWRSEYENAFNTTYFDLFSLLLVFSLRENEKCICFVIRFRIAGNFVSDGGTHTGKPWKQRYYDGVM